MRSRERRHIDDIHAEPVRSCQVRLYDSAVLDTAGLARAHPARGDPRLAGGEDVLELRARRRKPGIQIPLEGGVERPGPDPGRDDLDQLRERFRLHG